MLNSSSNLANARLQIDTFGMRYFAAAGHIIVFIYNAGGIEIAMFIFLLANFSIAILLKRLVLDSVNYKHRSVGVIARAQHKSSLLRSVLFCFRYFNLPTLHRHVITRIQAVLFSYCAIVSECCNFSFTIAFDGCIYCKYRSCRFSHYIPYL